LALESAGAGAGLMDSLVASVGRQGISIRYNTRATELIFDGDRVRGVKVRVDGERFEEVPADAVILACGGFEANPEMRVRYLGPGCCSVMFCGTRFYTGDGINIALSIVSASFGICSGCHVVGWDRYAFYFGQLVIRAQFQLHSYP